MKAEPTVQNTDEHGGYFPKGDSFGTIYGSYNAAVTTFSGNYWDNNLEEAP